MQEIEAEPWNVPPLVAFVGKLRIDCIAGGPDATRRCGEGWSMVKHLQRNELVRCCSQRQVAPPLARSASLATGRRATQTHLRSRKR